MKPNSSIFRVPGQSPGRAIVLPSALAVGGSGVVGVSKMLKFLR